MSLESIFKNNAATLLNIRNSKWNMSCQDVYKQMQEARSTGHITDDFLKKLWWERKNGIVSIKTGALSEEAFNKSKQQLRKLTLEIINDCSTDSYEKAIALFEKLRDTKVVKGGILYAVINRVYTAAHPAMCTMAVTHKLLNELIGQYNLNIKITDNWLKNSMAFKEVINKYKPDETSDIDVNILLWSLLRNAADPNKEENKIIDEEITLARLFSDYINQILYGPPGTGKTYATTELAVKIAEPDAYQKIIDESSNQRQSVKALYEQLIKEHRIAFTTFHQSFSYEDFVEGIRAEASESGISYNVEPGIFKQICERAGSDNILSIESALEQFKNKLSEEPIELKTATGKEFSLIYNGGKTFRCSPHASKEKLVLPANVEHVKSLLLGKKPENLYCASYVKAICAYIQKHYAIKNRSVETDTSSKPYIIIIDEINRGNISRIFGELITLLEPDKRKGGSDAREVILPYSKESFSVPANLYVLGTMNTADKSLAQLDLALRRRFEFIEFLPDPLSLEDVEVHGIQLSDLLDTLNQRIEVLLDRDHTIGHAYFWSLKGVESEVKKAAVLAQIFEKRIIPLLQEYFFSDWERIGWVLNDPDKPAAAQFIQVSNVGRPVSELFSRSVNGDINDRRYRINKEAFLNPEAYRAILPGAAVSDA